MRFLLLLPCVVLPYLSFQNWSSSLSLVEGHYRLWVCHILQYWVGLACPLGFFSILSFNSAGHHLLGFILLLNIWALIRPILLFKNDHFIMAISYVLLFFQRGPGPTLAFILYSQKYFSYLGHYLGLVYAFFFLWTFEYSLIAIALLMP